MSSTVQSSIDKLNKANSEWNVILTPEQYAVLFKAATERPYSHSLNDEKRKGTFIWAACQLPLFDSTAKYESGTGWPSFTHPIQGNIEKKRDFKLILPRTEYHCRRCGGHQGHVFKDGPQPTGKRWCNNGICLDFIPADEPLPELRT